MSSNWRTGKVESVKFGADGCVRQVTISYTDTSADNPEDWLHRSVDRPVRNIVKISHIDDTSLMDDITDIHNLSKKVIVGDIAQSLDDKPEVDVRNQPSTQPTDFNLDDQEVYDDVYENETFIDEEPQETPAPIPKKRKKKRTELENLEITLKGWNFATSVYQASPFTVDTIQNNMNAADDYKGGDGGQLRYGENEDADKEFNFVMNIDDFDNMYLL